MVEVPIAFIVVFINIILIPIIGFYIYSMYKLFEKCNIDGWKAIIPFYNTFIEIRLAGCNWWYIFVYVGACILSIDAGTGLRILCSLAILFVHSIVAYNLCKKVNNGKNSLMVDFLLLTFLPFIYLPVMALNDDYKYIEGVEVTPNAYIDEIQTGGFDDIKETKKTKNSKKKFCDKCGEPLSASNHFCPNCGKKI